MRGTQLRQIWLDSFSGWYVDVYQTLAETVSGARQTALKLDTLNMGQCVTKCKNPSSTLGSKNGERDSSKSHKRSSGHKEEHTSAGGKTSGDILVNGTKKAQDATVESCHPQPPSGDAKKKEPGLGAEVSSLQRIEELFRRYKDEREDVILEEGMERFCNDLSVDPTEFRVLVLAWKFQAATMCKFTRKEFFEGCKAINADSIEGICNRFPSLLNEAKQEDKFKDLYRFTFQFGLDSEEGQRSLHREIAIALWKLVFIQNKPLILDEWLDFLMENPSGIKGISRDTWNMFLNFTHVIGPDLSNYSEDEAWPSLFDTFVDWELERRRKEEATKCLRSTDTDHLSVDEQT
ncbi:PREDICTED: DCN1-like protein 3 [Nanorana parkeri]|uniref:DCN1-like protein 3 n=1 Tax=Nanorana parkeri TaxID=125878 RepID=UPI000853F1A9|nr:PREDICTED: DCN1-like protein 3 [Nanorana parkeri]